MRSHLLVCAVLAAGLGLAIAACTRASPRSDAARDAQSETRPPQQPSDAAQDILVVNMGGVIFSLRGDGTGRRQLVGGGGLKGFCLSPDRRSAVFADPTGLAIADLATGAIVRVPETKGASCPQWSPDGSRIAYRSDNHGGIWVTEVQTPRPWKVSGTTDLRGVSYDFAWSPDGARLAIAGQADDQWRIYVADLTQNSLKPVTLGIGDADSPSWAPAGDELAFCRDTPPGQHADPTSARVCVVTVDEGKERQVSARSAWRVAWSPDGRSLALSSTALYVVDPAGDREVQVTDPAEAGRTSVSDLDPKWSRDSRRIYFLRWDRGLPGDEAPVIRCLGLYSVSRDGGPARLVLEEVGINEFDV